MNTALITGASSGIGKELAYIHAKKKGDLVLVARNLEKLTEIKAELESDFGINVHIIQKDLSFLNAAQEIFNEVKSNNIEIDYLINNAGFGGIGRFNERPLHEDLNMIQLNIVALTALTHLFLQDFLVKNQGKILNVSSTASLIPGPMQSVYYATKAYVTSFSNAVWQELKDTNVTLTNLMPGATETNFGKTSGMDKTSLFDKTASAESVALDGYTGMLKGALNVVSGLTFSQKILLKISTILPQKTVLRMVYDMQQLTR
ncbi:SDR family NAD(P)-dependent oxidoreductase [Wenyingzhuangia sp. IMCC45574]